MFLLPYQRLNIFTLMSPVEALERLAAEVGPRRGVLGGFWGADYKPYTGTVDGTGFKLTRNIVYRNSFRPVISGRVSMTAGCTVVQVSLRPDVMVLVFMAVWLAFVGRMELLALLGYLQGWQAAGGALEWPSYTVGVPGLMLLLGYSLMWVAFRVEAAISVRFLRHVFAGSLRGDTVPSASWRWALVLLAVLGMAWLVMRSI